MKNYKSLFTLTLLAIFTSMGISISTACADAATDQTDQKEVSKRVKKPAERAEHVKTERDKPLLDDPKLEERKVSGFTGVHIGGTMSADITAGKDFKVTLEAEADILPKVITVVKKGILYVKWEKDFWKNMRGNRRNTKVRVTISLPKLDDVDISGASTGSVAGVDTNKMNIDVSGASTLSITGNARDLNVDLSGASSMRALDLKSESAKVDLSGASSAKLSVSGKLDVDASGASSVCYSGNPTVTKDTNGSSSVRNGC